MKEQKVDILGVPVPNWVAPLSPDQMQWGDEMQGRFVRLEPLSAARHDDLFAAFASIPNTRFGIIYHRPFATAQNPNGCTPHAPNQILFFAIIDQPHRAVGGCYWD